MNVTFAHLEMLYELLHSQAVMIREQQADIQQLQRRLNMTPVPPNGNQALEPVPLPKEA